MKNLRFCFILCNLATIFACSVAYVRESLNNSTKLADTIMAFITIFSCLSYTGSYVDVFMNERKLKDLHEELQRLVSKGKFSSHSK